MSYVCLFWRKVSGVVIYSHFWPAADITLEYVSSMVVMDPSRLESLLAQGTLTVTLNSQQEICVLTKSGGVPLTADEIMKTVMMGAQKVKEIDAAIKGALEREAKRRIIEVR